jgi:hypothetical protein
VSAAGGSQDDVEVTDHGTIVLFRPLSEACRAWIVKNVNDEAMWFGGALAVEHRFAWDLAGAMADVGLAFA